MVNSYIPDKDDIVMVDFSPQVGREQSGYRPAIVLSNQKFNRRTDFIFCCPITSKKKRYPFEVDLLFQKNTKGVVLCDQLKRIDWKQRDIKFKEIIHTDTLDQIIHKLTAVLHY